MTQPSERDREMARQIAREVAELPGRTSPDDEPGRDRTTRYDVRYIAEVYLAAARSEERERIATMVESGASDRAIQSGRQIGKTYLSCFLRSLAQQIRSGQ